MVGYKAAVEIIQENLRGGRGPKTAEKARSVFKSVSSFGPDTQGLEDLKINLKNLILKLEAEEVKKEMEVTLPIPVRKVPVMLPAGVTLAKSRQDLVKQIQEQIVIKSNIEHSRWMSSGDD